VRARRTDGRVAAILAELRGLGSERNRAGMARYGINVARAFGVSIHELRTVARRLGTDHALALALWEAGNHEARLLACFVDDPGAVTEAQAEAWARDFDSWDLCDQATTSLLDRTPFAWKKAAEWAGRREPWVKRGGFALMAGLAVHDETATDRDFTRLLPLIEREAWDERNFVRKAVNWALRNIGKRNRSLNAAAIACAERLRAAADERAGGARGGDPAVRSARWVAADALRELGSEKVRARLVRGPQGRPRGLEGAGAGRAGAQRTGPAAQASARRAAAAARARASARPTRRGRAGSAGSTARSPRR
jgi:3-methyladenine DNA glycosylase AlkD